MTNQQHPITPSDQQIDKWESELLDHNVEPFVVLERAFQAGADQELEACCEWLDREGWSGESRQLRAARRPKPPSLKEQALDALKMHFAAIGENQCYQPAHEQIIRRALEQLND